MDKLKSVFDLRKMLHKMEKDIGLGGLSRTERDVLMAAHALTDAPGVSVDTDQIRRQALISTLAPATYHRALRSLLHKGYIENAVGTKTRQYIVRDDLLNL